MTNAMKASLTACVLLFSAPSVALAHKCDDGGFENIHGQWVATPYCEEELAAQISRRDHWHYTASQLHSSPASMEEFCRGNANPDVTTACAPYRD